MPCCYIDGSTRFVDDHHLDCKEGKVSPETIPLCRRCHRTYHDWGVDAFSPDTTIKALEVENKRRMIYGLPLMSMAQISRSGYWRKKWGVTSPRKAKARQVPLQFPLFEIVTRTGSLVKRE